MMTHVKRNIIIFAGGMLALAMLLSGCSTVKFKAIEAGGKDIDSLKTNLVRIENRTNDGTVIQGTGFFTESGALITTSNIVDEPGKITVIYSDGQRSPATLVSNRADTNTAALQTTEAKASAVELSSVSSDEDFSEQGEAMEVVGYDENGIEAESIPVTVKKDKLKNGKVIFIITQGLSQSYSGALLVDSNGEIVGQVTLASGRLDYALASDIKQLSSETDSLVHSQKKTLHTSENRTNQYTDYVENVMSEDISDIYLPETYLKGEVSTDSGVVLSVNQNNSPLVKVHYDATKAKREVPFEIDGADQPIAFAQTDNGSYYFPLTRMTISVGEIGDFYLFFEDLSDTIRSISISGLTDPYEDTVTIEFY